MALDSLNKITIDVSDPLTTPVVKAVQEDIRSRYVEITLVSNGEPLAIPAMVGGMVGVRRPNGTYVLYDQTEDETQAVIFNNNIATVYLSQEALSVAGRLYTSVSIYSTTQRLTAFHFVVDVEPTAVPSGVVIESDYFNILQGVVEDAVTASHDAIAAADRAQFYGGGTVVVVTKLNVSSLPVTIESPLISSGMVLVESSLSNPSAQWGDWVVTPSVGSISITGIIAGTTDITLVLGLATGEYAALVVVGQQNVSSLPITIFNADINSGMVVAEMSLTNSSAQWGDWMATVNNGSVTVSGSINGITDISIILAET